MSSLLVLQDKNNVIMTSDTASSVEIDGIPYRVSDTEKKIFTINGYKVFASGQKHIRDLFISLFNSDESTFNPTNAEKLLKKMFLNFDEYSLEVVIAEKNLNSTTLYFLSSYDQFDIKKSFSEDENILMFTAGVKTKEISDSFEEEFSKSGNVIDSLQVAYSLNQNEQVGGSLEIHQLANDSVRDIQLPAIKLNTIQQFENVNLIIAERIVGKLLMGNRLIIEDDDGIIRLSGSLQEVFDPSGKVKVALGQYEPGKYGIKIDAGALEIVGGLTENQLSQSVIDKFSQDDGIRTDLRLTAPLPTNITLNGEGITATVTGNANKFARMDYRGLYIQGGAMDIRTSATTNSGVVFNGLGISAYNSSGTRTFYVDTNGYLTAQTGTFGGSLNAATGSFSGSLSAASGTFRGDISGATGTFSGNLSGASGTFRGDISGSTGTFGGTYTGTLDAEKITGNILTMTHGSTTLQISGRAGNQFVESRNAGGFAIRSDQNISLQAGGGQSVFVGGGDLRASAGLTVTGGVTQFYSSNNTGTVTINGHLKVTSIEVSGGSGLVAVFG